VSTNPENLVKIGPVYSEIFGPICQFFSSFLPRCCKNFKFYTCNICGCWSRVHQIFTLCTRCASKKLSHRKLSYFINSSMDLGQTFRLCTWVFTQNMLHLLKQLKWFNRYSSLNFKVQFSSEQAVMDWIFADNKSNFAELITNSSNIKVTNVSYLKHQLQQHTKKSVPKWHDLNLYQWTPAAKTVFQLGNVGQFWSVSLTVFQHCTHTW